MQLTQQGYILGKGYLLAEQNTYVVVGGANVDTNGHSDGLFILGEHVHLVSPIELDECGD